MSKNTTPSSIQTNTVRTAVRTAVETPTESTNPKNNSPLIKNIKQEVHKSVVVPETPDIPRIKELLNNKTPVVIEVCRVLKEGLNSTKPITLDGEIHYTEDYEVRRKYAETILEIIGERKLSPNDERVKVDVQNINIITSKAVQEAMAKFKLLKEKENNDGFQTE